jgi:hypothetical protein
MAALTAACGKKAPPLPPLNLVPDRPADTAGRVAGDRVYLSMTVPVKNTDGRGTLALDHLEIYAVTVDKGAVAPPNRDLLTTAHAIARIPVQPPVDPDEEEEPDPDDTRPKAGDRIVFAERLSEAQTIPEVKATAANAKQAAAAASAPAAQPAAPGASSTPTVPPLISPESVPATGSGAGVVGVPSALPATAAAGEESGESESAGTGTAAPGAAGATQAAAPATAPQPAPTVTRVYLVRGVTKKGHPGTPSVRVVVPIVPPPPPPTGLTVDYSEASVTLAWKAPDQTSTEPHAAVKYNVYPQTPAPASASPATPAAPGLVSVAPALNAAPLETPSFEHPGAEPGKPQCFVVTTVETVASMSIESAPTDPVCVTPVDRFAPAPPANLAVVATTGAMNLIWDANAEADVAGYLVLRGATPGDTLQPLTPEPIRETRFRDTTAQPGVRYAYAIVAVDRAGNRSAPSARVEETAR